MYSEPILDLFYRILIAGEASPEESFLVTSYLAIAVFAFIAVCMLLSNNAIRRRRLATQHYMHIIQPRHARL